MIGDAELLRRYAEERSQEAFAELVRRRVNLVYSVAVRQVGGDVHLAEDVTQRVFTDLARKAKQLASHAVLNGWLYRSAQFAATDVVRAERRRRIRDQEAHIMIETSTSDAPADWEKLRLLLDQVLGELDAEDRDALALRFFEERSFAEVGAAIQLTEEAARKRVSRALDKLHGLLARLGVTSTTAALGLALAGQTSVAAPMGLAATVASGAIAGVAGGLAGVGGVGTAAAFFTFMNTSKIAVGIAGIIACVAVGTALFETKALQETKLVAATAGQQRDATQAKLRELEGRLAVQSQRAAVAEEDIDKLLLGIKSMQTAAAAGVDSSPARLITSDDVAMRYKRARELASAGQTEEALKEFIWCYDEGMVRVGSYAAVRLSGVLMEIEKIGSLGVAALQQRRDAARDRMLAASNDSSAMLEFVSINRALKQDDLTLATYDQLAPDDQRRRTLAQTAYEQLISARRYADALQGRSFSEMAIGILERPLPVNMPNAAQMRQRQRDFNVKTTAKGIEVLAGAGDLENARKLAAKLIAYDGAPETKAPIQQHAARAGQPGLLAEGQP